MCLLFPRVSRARLHTGGCASISSTNRRDSPTERSRHQRPPFSVSLPSPQPFWSSPCARCVHSACTRGGKGWGVRCIPTILQEVRARAQKWSSTGWRRGELFFRPRTALRALRAAQRPHMHRCLNLDVLETFLRHFSMGSSPWLTRGTSIKRFF